MSYDNLYWLDETNGDDGNDGLGPNAALKTDARIIDILNSKDPAHITRNLIISLPEIDFSDPDVIREARLNTGYFPE